jgi:ATP-dependent DNA ligase
MVSNFANFSERALISQRNQSVFDSIRSAALPAYTALLDGELVVENENGISSFSLVLENIVF